MLTSARSSRSEAFRVISTVSTIALHWKKYMTATIAARPTLATVTTGSGLLICRLTFTGFCSPCGLCSGLVASGSMMTGSSDEPAVRFLLFCRWFLCLCLPLIWFWSLANWIKYCVCRRQEEGRDFFPRPECTHHEGLRQGLEQLHISRSVAAIDLGGAAVAREFR